jgi:hypothetical protein
MVCVARRTSELRLNIIALLRESGNQLIRMVMLGG